MDTKKKKTSPASPITAIAHAPDKSESFHLSLYQGMAKIAEFILQQRKTECSFKERSIMLYAQGLHRDLVFIHDPNSEDHKKLSKFLEALIRELQGVSYPGTCVTWVVKNDKLINDDIPAKRAMYAAFDRLAQWDEAAAEKHRFRELYALFHGGTVPTTTNIDRGWETLLENAEFEEAWTASSSRPRLDSTPPPTDMVDLDWEDTPESASSIPSAA